MTGRAIGCTFRCCRGGLLAWAVSWAICWSDARTCAVINVILVRKSRHFIFSLDNNSACSPTVPVISGPFYFRSRKAVDSPVCASGPSRWCSRPRSWNRSGGHTPESTRRTRRAHEWRTVVGHSELCEGSKVLSSIQTRTTGRRPSPAGTACRRACTAPAHFQWRRFSNARAACQSSLHTPRDSGRHR